MKGSGEDERRSRGIGERFHEETKYTAGQHRRLRPQLAGDTRDIQELSFPHRDDCACRSLSLGRLQTCGRPSAGEGRRVPSAPARTLPLGLLSSLLWSTQGITAEAGELVFQGRPFRRWALPRRDLHPGEGGRGTRTRHIPLQAPRVRPGVHQGAAILQHILAEAALGQDMIRRGSDNVHMDCRRCEEHVEVPAKGLPVHLSGCRSYCPEPVSCGDGSRPRRLRRGRLL